MEDLWFANNDISVDVLARLPTKTLLELKCVSKEWHRLISEPCFIKQKLKTKEPVSGFFFQERFQWCDNDIKTISYIKTPENNRIGGTEIHRAVFDFLPDDVVLLAACNGLICCRSCLPCSQPVVYICNPSNKEWVTLQWPGTDKWISLGLAFDPFKNSADNTTNFKVVRVHQTLTEKDDSYYSTFSFDIYSSETRMWAKLEKTYVCKHNLYKNKGICVRGGALFWLTDGDQILMFDTENEVARFVKVPVPLMGYNSIPEMCIGESEDKLHYVLISKEGILIWALEDYIEFNWTLMYFVDLDEMEQENYGFLCNVREKVASRIKLDMIPCIDPLAYKDGSLLMRVSTKIFLYNFNTRKMEELCNISSLGPNSMFAPIVLPYSMSLVPLAWP